MANNPNSNNPLLLKIVAGLVSAGFTLMLILMNNMWTRMNSMDENISKLLVCNASVSTASTGATDRLTKVEGDVSQLWGEVAKLYAMKPDEITVKRYIK